MNANHNKIFTFFIGVVALVVLIPWPTQVITFTQSLPPHNDWSILQTMAVKSGETIRQRIWLAQPGLIAIRLFGPSLSAAQLTGTLNDQSLMMKQISPDSVHMQVSKPLAIGEQWVWLAVTNTSPTTIRFWYEQDASKYPSGQLWRLGPAERQIAGVLAFSLYERQYRWLGR